MPEKKSSTLPAFIGMLLCVAGFCSFGSNTTLGGILVAIGAGIIIYMLITGKINTFGN